MSNVKALDPKAVYRFVPKCDIKLPESEQFTIKYNPLDMRKDAEITDAQIFQSQKGRTSEYRFAISQADIKRMELSIVGWDNFNYPEDFSDKSVAGKPVPFSKENIAIIPPDIRSEFVTVLTGRDKIKEGEEGTSGEAVLA